MINEGKVSKDIQKIESIGKSGRISKIPLLSDQNLVAIK